jgi:molybdopterin converting factor small subunit
MLVTLARTYRSSQEFWQLKVTVKFVGGAREIVGARELIVDVKTSATVLEILRMLIAKHGNQLEEYLFDPESNNPRQHLRFLLNGQSVSVSEVITGNSIILIFPPVGGG